jgi:hypothetical protein
MLIAHPRETHDELESWKTNDILPEITQNKIRRLLEKAVEDMHDLDREISETQQRPWKLQKHLGVLQHQKTKDTARICILCGAISSLKKIPPEILNEIFIHLSPMTVLLPPMKNSFPWILMHVCAHWKNIVWTSPRIWSNIQIALLNHLSKSHDSTCAAFLHILSTTRFLLSFHAIIDMVTAPVLDLVLSHSRRFRKLALGLSQDALESLPRHSWENLEYLEIRCYGIYTPSHNTSSSLQTAPNLRQVSFTTLFRGIVAPPLLFSWEKLTEISITNIDIPPTTIHTSLQHCPALLKCILSIGTDTIPDSLPNTTFTLPKVKLLDLSFHYAIDWGAFFQPFLTPSLKDLRIIAPGPPLQTFTSLIIRSECAVETINLDLSSEHPSVSDYEVFLIHLPAMTNFETSWVTPASIVRKIHNTLLPVVKISAWRVFPDGLEAFLDYIDAYISTDLPDSERQTITMHIICFRGPGYSAVERRYRQSHERYERYGWLYLTVRNGETWYGMQVVLDSEEGDMDMDDDDDDDDEYQGEDDEENSHDGSDGAGGWQ